MVSKEQTRPTLHDRYELFLSAANSDAVKKSWIPVDQRHEIERLDQHSSNESSHTSTSSNEDDDNVHDSDGDQESLPKVTVGALEKGFLLDVFSERSCPGLLVFILEAIEEVGLGLLDARVSCSDCFHLQAVGEENERAVDNLDAEVVRHALLQAISNWNGST